MLRIRPDQPNAAVFHLNGSSSRSIVPTRPLSVPICERSSVMPIFHLQSQSVAGCISIAFMLREIRRSEYM